MFDDNTQAKAAPDANPIAANDQAVAASVASTISVPSVPSVDNSVATPDPTMSSAPAPAPQDPPQETSSFNTTALPEITAQSSVSEPSTSSESTTAPSISNFEPINSSNSDDSEELIDLKQQALRSLSPLLSHLDQTPEEKFRTTMMMIQASDDQSLVKTAYDAAQGITDEKSKAQALLDIVNEINYFTQNGKN